MTHKNGEWWSEKKKLETVTTYLVLGKIPLVSASTGVPEGTIRRWMVEPWWKEMVLQVQQDSDQELDSRLATHLQKVLDLVQDRLDNGDFMFDPKKGEFVRKPVALKDGWKVGREMVDVRMMLRKHKPEQVSQEGVADILKGLAQEFAQMARKKYGTQLQERVPELSGETQPNQEEKPAEQSATPSNEGGVGA